MVHDLLGPAGWGEVLRGKGDSMKTTEKELLRSRISLLSLVEDMGSVACLLREAHGDIARGGAAAADRAIEDAISLLSAIERASSEIAADLAKINGEEGTG